MALNMDVKFSKRPDCCPLCREQKTGLEFHHWDYDDETGCYLCEPCHIAVHGGTEWWNANDRPRKSSTWIVAAIENLVQKHLEKHPDENATQEIVDKYNIPDDEKRGHGVSVAVALEKFDAKGGG